MIAILLAIGTGWLTLSYISSIQHANEPSGQPQQVLVATQDIPARVTITQSMFRTETRPQSALQPDALGDPSRAIGSLALITIPSGSQITASQVGSHADFALPVRLQPGMRAVSIQIDKVKGVSGLVQPGDRVDVIAVPPRSGNVPPQASAILRGSRVLAIGTSLEYASATPSPDMQNSTTVTLEVTPKQADLLAMADVNTTLRLALRSPKEPIRSAPTEQLSFSIAQAEAPQPQQSKGGSAADALAANMFSALMGQRNPQAASPARNAHTNHDVQLIVGDQILVPGSSAAAAQPNTDSALPQ
ncbi:MAG: Flp pilus assembly protein CpaB [Vulcanimicrobiaceae bacterium]